MKTKKILLLAVALCMFILALSSCEQLHRHTWTDATCTAPKTCTKCGATEGEALGHTEEKVDGRAATCTDAGLTDGTKCKVCGLILQAQDEIPALGHDEVSYDAKESTCAAGGWDAYVACSRCDYSTKVEKAPLDHSFTN